MATATPPGADGTASPATTAAEPAPRTRRVIAPLSAAQSAFNAGYRDAMLTAMPNVIVPPLLTTRGPRVMRVAMWSPLCGGVA